MNELSKTLANEISGFSTAIKNLAPHIYQIYVHQQIVSSICNIISWFVGCVILFYGGQWLIKFGTKEDEELFKGWGIFACVVAVCALVITFFSNLPSIINPEYYAIKDLIKSFIK